jgi:hypothetical protein
MSIATKARRLEQLTEGVAERGRHEDLRQGAIILIVHRLRQPRRNSGRIKCAHVRTEGRGPLRFPSAFSIPVEYHSPTQNGLGAALPEQHNGGIEETMDAWRTSCPRLPVWEDAADHRLVSIDHTNGRPVVRVMQPGRRLKKPRPECVA